MLDKIQPGYIRPDSDHPKQQRLMPTETVRRSGAPDAPLPFFRKPGAPLSGADLRRPAAPGENRKRDRRSKQDVEADRAAREAAKLAQLPSPDQIPEPPVSVDPQEYWRDVREAYRDDPNGFVVDVLGPATADHPELVPDPWQAELLDLVGAGTRRISVCSGVNVGKTAVASWVVIWHAVCRYPQKTIITGPVAGQLRSGLIPELKMWFNRLPAPLLDLFEIKSESIVLKQAPYNSFIEARTASRENPEALQGIHSEAGSVLFVVDEASGVPDSVYDAGRGSMAGPNAHMILISNPTRLTGYFYESQHDLADTAPNPIPTPWKTLHISSIDKTRTLRDNDNLAAEVAAEEGIESDEYRKRILGLFPHSEANLLIAPELIDSALVRDIAVNPSDPLIYGVDVGRLGNDKTALVKRRGNVVLDAQSWAKKDLAQSAALIWAQAQQDNPDEICIDAIGYGAGTADVLRALGCKVVRDVNVAEAASTNPVCEKLRDDLWWSLREWLATRTVRLYQHDDLIEDLRMPTYSYTTGSQKVKVLSKDLMRKVIGRSPDFGDALCLTFAGQGALLSGRTSQWGSWQGSLRRNLAGVV